MSGSAEKSRLVPVLSTILKLSPAEIETIQKTINGIIILNRLPI